MIAGVTWFLAACTTTSSLPPAPLVPTATRAENLTPYYLQVGDVLDIRLMLNPELNDEVAVRPDGHIATTVVPDEIAAGRTVGELTRALSHDYAQTMKDVKLAVLVKTFAATQVYVGGEVPGPGVFNVSSGSPMSLSQAVARAGGLKFSADEKNIFIIRRVGTSQPVYMSVRYGDIIHAKNPAADIILAPSDVIYVPRTGIGEVYAWYNQYIEQFAHPSVGFNYLLNDTGSAGSVINTPTAVAPTH
jgi:polysaccharide export outer membrane protein